MNKNYLIFIVACLTEQLKADVYTVELDDITKGDKSLATVGGTRCTPTVTFLNDVNQGDIKVHVRFLDSRSQNYYNTTLDDPCDMDPSTEEGTMAAILWGALGIDSCPIKAGDHKSVEMFNQTGYIADTWDYVGELTTFIFMPETQEGQKYFKLSTKVYLAEEDSAGHNDKKK